MPCTIMYTSVRAGAKAVSCTSPNSQKGLLITEPAHCLKQENPPKPIPPYGYAAPSIVLQSPKLAWLSYRILSAAHSDKHLLPAGLHSSSIPTNIIDIQSSRKSFHVSTFAAASAGKPADVHTGESQQHAGRTKQQCECTRRQRTHSPLQQAAARAQSQAPTCFVGTHTCRTNTVASCSHSHTLALSQRHAQHAAGKEKQTWRRASDPLHPYSLRI